jgi:hypothetical protein
MGWMVWPGTSNSLAYWIKPAQMPTPSAMAWAYFRFMYVTSYLGVLEQCLRPADIYAFQDMLETLRSCATLG